MSWIDRFRKSDSGFGRWYRQHKNITIESNGSYKHYFVKGIIMNYVKWIIIACVIASYPIIFYAGRWVEVMQFRLFCFGN